MKLISVQYAIILFLTIVGVPFGAAGQFTNEFTIGEYVELFVNDSIKIHFNCTGKVCRKSCAEFYRVGKIDKERINVSGPFRDYYLHAVFY